MITQITYHTSPSCLQTIPPKQVKDVFFSFHRQCLFIDNDLCVPFLVSIYLFTSTYVWYKCEIHFFYFIVVFLKILIQKQLINIEGKVMFNHEWVKQLAGVFSFSLYYFNSFENKFLNNYVFLDFKWTFMYIKCSEKSNYPWYHIIYCYNYSWWET